MTVNDSTRAGLPRGTASTWLRRGLLGLLVVLAGVAIIRLVGRIDWEIVWDSLTHLSWWQLLVLAGLLTVRQVLNAAPLALFIPGVSLYRVTINDLGASSLSVLAPPPSDMALRVAMFKSWGVDTSAALAGTAMNALSFYFVRFSAPFLGFVLLVVTRREAGFRWLDLISLLIAAVILAGLLLIARADSWARWVGLNAGRITRSVKHSVDPETWAESCCRFRHGIASRFNYAFPRSVLVTQAMLLADLLIIYCALRFVGVGAADATFLDVAIAFLFAFPLTAFPMSGMGLVDALILAAIVESGGHSLQEPAIAALVIWRVFTIAGPFFMGLGATALWRHSLRTAD